MKSAAALSLLGGAFVLAGILLPPAFSFVGWGLGFICIVAALVIALITRRKERALKEEGEPSP